MKLFSKAIDKKLFQQYPIGSELSKQDVVVKIFNPSGRGTWYILNSDPEDPDYLWAIVDLGYGAEVGSVSRNDLEAYRGGYGLGLERDLSFDPINAEELYKGLRQGKHYEKGGILGDEVTLSKGYGYYDLSKYPYGNDFKRFVEPVKGKFTKGTIKVGGQIRVLLDDGREIITDKQAIDLPNYEEKDDLYQKNKHLFTFGYEKGGKLEKGSIITLKNDVYASYSRKKIPSGTELKLISTPTKPTIKGWFVYAKTLDGKEEARCEKEDFIENIKELKDNFAEGGKVSKKETEVWGYVKSNGELYYFSSLSRGLDDLMMYEKIDVIQLNDYDGGKDFFLGYGSKSNVNGISEKKSDGRLFFGKWNKGFVYNENYPKDNMLARHKIKYEEGGSIENLSDNQRMIMNQNVEIEHHHEELEEILEDKIEIPAWVVAKMATATQSISDVTHYLDGQKELMDGEDKENEENQEENEEQKEDQEEIEKKEVVEPINVSAGTKAELTKKFTDDAWGNLKGFLKGKNGIDLNDDYTFNYRGEKFEIEPIINSDENGVSNAIFSIIDIDGEETGEVAYSRNGGKQKFTANSEFFGWNNTKFEDGGFMNVFYADGGNTAIDNLNKNTELREKMISYIVNIKSKGQLSYKQYDALEKRISQKSFTQLKKEYDALRENNSYAKGGEINLWKSEPKNKPEKLKTFKSIRAFNAYMTKNAKLFRDEHSKNGTGFYGFEADATQQEVERSLGNLINSDNQYADGGFMTNVYAKGGEIVKAEIIGLSKNILGTTDIEMKISGMRKPQDFSVYPIAKDESDKVITIQSSTRIGLIDLNTGRGMMSQSHSSGAYFVHLKMDKLIPFMVSESDLEDIKTHIFKTAGSSVGNSIVKSDNSGASRIFANGGDADNKYNYMLLARLVSDCKYYLGHGNRSENRLWAGSVDAQIKEMKKLWNNLPKNGKPEWLSMSDILDYEKKMKNQYSYGGEAERDLKQGDIVKFKNPLENENPNSRYVILEITYDEPQRALIQILGSDFSIPPTEKVRVSDLEFVSSSEYSDGGYFDGAIPNTYSYMTSFANGGSLEEKLTKLEKKKSDLESKLFEAKLVENEKFNNLGWGAGMRRSKISISYTKTDSLKERIKVVEKEIEGVKKEISGNRSKDEGYNLKDINGKKIEVGDTVKTTQFSGGLLNPASPEVGIVEKTKDAFGNDGLQIKYRKEGTNYDRFILLNGQINEIVKKAGSSSKEKKYILKSDIKTVTLKRNGKEMTYKGSDVLNGANVLADGGDLTSKANYVPKRDVVEVELKDGSKIKPVNGYWVKKGAEEVASKKEFDYKDLPKNGSDIYINAPAISGQPAIDLVLKYDSKNFRFDVYKDGVKKDMIGEKEVLNNLNSGIYVLSDKLTPTSSGVSEPKIEETEIRKDARGNWRAETNIDNFNGYDWRISTVKTYSGNLVSSAQGGKTEDTGTRGISMFKYTMYQDPNHTLEVSKPKRLTDKVVSEQHEKALAKFKKFMETGMFKGGGKISNFDKLSAKVAKEYEGKPVKSQYQEEYGKYYSKEEAQEVGDKVAGKVKAMQVDKKAFGGIFNHVKNIIPNSPKYPDLDGKQVALKSGKYVQVFSQSGNKLDVIELGKIGNGDRPHTIDISEVDMTSFEMGGSTSKKTIDRSGFMKEANDLAKKIRKDGESWNDAKKRAFAQLKSKN